MRVSFFLKCMFIFLPVWLCTTTAMATVYYVHASNGSDVSTGTSVGTPWKTVARVNSESAKGTFVPGDSVLFEKSQTWTGQLDVHSQGSVWNHITFASYTAPGNDTNSSEKPVLWGIKVYINGSYTTYQGLIVDHNKEAGDAFSIRGALGVIIRDVEIRNGTGDGLDVDEANGLLVENSHIHHFLAGSYTTQVDAHGIVATDTDGITIRGTKLHHVSGDLFQTDPDRDPQTPNNILIENSTFWTGALAEDFNAGWLKTDYLPEALQQIPSENAIDTKMVTTGWEDDNVIKRMNLTIRNSVFYGWKKGSYIQNRAVLNLKEKIEATIDGITVYDSEIAFRIRGTRGNANVTVKNSVIFGCDTALRAEDNVANLKMYNTTFGTSIGTYISHAGGSGGVATWDFKNNAFVGSKPVEASDVSNKVASGVDFVDAAGNDYHLDAGSVLIDAGEVLPAVGIDREGNLRSYFYDVGAYELTTGQDMIPPASPSNLQISE